MKYVDANAPGSNDPTFAKPAKIYAYAVSAVDAWGNESDRKPAAIWMFRGKSNCGGSDLSYGEVTANFSDKAGVPENGPYDVAVVYPGSGGFQPITNPPLCPNVDLEIGGCNTFTIGVKVTDDSFRPIRSTSAIRRGCPGRRVRLCVREPVEVRNADGGAMGHVPRAACGLEYGCVRVHGVHCGQQADGQGGHLGQADH